MTLSHTIFNFMLYNKIVNGGNNMELIVNNERCPQNHPCPAVKVCPVNALTQIGNAAPTVNKDKCIKCGKCSTFCPKKALVLE